MFSGSIPALITPWKNGSIDEDALKGLIDWHVESGTSALLPCGTTGESPSFTHEEQHHMIKRCVEIADGRLPVIAGAGSNNTKEAVSLAEAAERMGANAILTITPYYNKPPQEGIFQHFKAVREACTLPMILYNVPSRTGINLLPETAARVAALGNVDSVKEASGDLGQAQDLLDLGVRVLSGEDGLVLPLMSLGASGVISVVANFAPRIMADLCAAVSAQDLSTAQKLHSVIHDLAKVAFMETNPLPAKAALAAMGKCNEDLRLPLVPMTDAGKVTLLACLKKHGILA
ncbi:MAG: 4-hydroxy-tetrahydrodipicolinate synthase [Planctomycetes bacterium]|nr:4-hydroxy-tetrahydrodipicolinate synthase [Planctomycetota bacterium]